MQAFQFQAFSAHLSSSAPTSHHHTLRERAHYLITRAYQNLYGQSLPDDAEYQHMLCNAAWQLIQDTRAQSMSDKLLLKAFEDIIRISDEHAREARKHLSRASNPVYLREMALDNALEHQKYLQALDEIMPQSQVRVVKAEHSGRVHRHGRMEHTEVVEVTCQQLAATLECAS